MKSEKTLWILLAVLTFGSANAQQEGTLDVQTTVEKVQVSTNAAGEEVTELVPAETVVPGERVIYTTSFRNTGSDPADNVVITNPISENLLYVEGSAFGPGLELEFSVDGGQTFAAAESLTVIEGDAERSATPDDYTHIRWSMPGSLDTGAQGIVRFSAILK
ncbi:MAG: hypothetical protein AAGA33_09270 [Pseudomonadota bacterium]